MRQMLQGDERTGIDSVNDAARSDESVQINLSNGRSCWVVMQRRISVRPHVRRQGDGAHIDGTFVRDFRGPIQLERRVAGKDRAACVDGWGNVPNFFHEAQR